MFFFATIFQKREMFPDLAPLMWHSFGTMFVLLQVCSNPCALLCILIVWSSLLGALSVFFHVLFPWSICYVSHSWFNPRVHGYISFLNICLWSLNQSVQPFGLTTYLVCLSTWKKNRKLCHSTLHFRLLRYLQVYRTEPAMFLHFFRYVFRKSWVS